MKYLINKLSIMAGRKFHDAYHDDNTGRQTNAWLNIYVGLRQMLPKVETVTDNNHYGNHHGSDMKPWKATQGF